MPRLKALICGSRDWDDKQAIWALVETLVETFDDVFIVHGAQRGADQLAGEVALEFELECLAVPARWNKFGKGAGPKRNQRMLDLAKPHIVYAFHEDVENSKGTKNMVRLAGEAGIETIVFKNLEDVLRWKRQ